MPASRRVFFALVVFTVNTYCSAQESCHTPLNKPGSCINLQRCTPLVSILQKRPIPADDLDFLRKSSCGFEGNAPKVCCPGGGTSTGGQTTTPQTRPPPPVAPTSTTSTLLPNINTCGISAIDKIVGGEATELNEFPWMALLEYQKPVGRGFYCGGVLISKRYVLTAAHCVIGKDIPKTWSLVSVRLGEYDTEKDIDCLDNGVDRECADAPLDVLVEEQIAHEAYDPQSRSQPNDIALLRLDSNVPFSDFVKPICLPLHSVQNNDLYVAGWGKTESKSESNVKLKVKVPIVTNPQCTPIYSNAAVTLGSGQLCAGGDKGKDSCRGDSGGPLMTVAYDHTTVPTSINWMAVGVVSFGPSPCGTKGWPGVYTNVKEYIPWIISKLRP